MATESSNQVLNDELEQAIKAVQEIKETIQALMDAIAEAVVIICRAFQDLFHHIYRWLAYSQMRTWGMPDRLAVKLMWKIPASWAERLARIWINKNLLTES